MFRIPEMKPLVFLAATWLAIAPAQADAGRVHRFAISIDADLTVLDVRACFEGAPPEMLVAESLDAPLALIDASIEGSSKPLVPSGALSLRIADDGKGLASDFELESGNSLGLRIANALAGQLSGRFALHPGPEGGAVARLDLPARAH